MNPVPFLFVIAACLVVVMLAAFGAPGKTKRKDDDDDLWDGWDDFVASLPPDPNGGAEVPAGRPYSGRERE